jgi:hypothetical protein
MTAIASSACIRRVTRGSSGQEAAGRVPRSASAPAREASCNWGNTASTSSAPSALLTRSAVAALGPFPRSSRSIVLLLTPAASASERWVWPASRRSRAKCESCRRGDFDTGRDDLDAICYDFDASHQPFQGPQSGFGGPPARAGADRASLDSRGDRGSNDPCARWLAFPCAAAGLDWRRSQIATRDQASRPASRTHRARRCMGSRVRKQTRRRPGLVPCRRSGKRSRRGELRADRQHTRGRLRGICQTRGP